MTIRETVVRILFNPPGHFERRIKSDCRRALEIRPRCYPKHFIDSIAEIDMNFEILKHLTYTLQYRGPPESPLQPDVNSLTPLKISQYLSF